MRHFFRFLRGKVLAPTLAAIEDLARHHTADYRQLEALASLLAVLHPRVPFPPFRGWAVSPDFAVLLLTQVVTRRPACVVELGSGVSTLVLGYALEQTHGHLVSVDHDLLYAEQSRATVAQHALQKVVTIVHAPLEPWRGGTPWYSDAWVQELPPVDLLVVDGPPGNTGSLARYPALPVLAPHLTTSATIVVDDAFRADERAMVARWLTEHTGLTATRLETEKGALVLARR
jgi:predicted O-methyltransferase YrrM